MNFTHFNTLKVAFVNIASLGVTMLHFSETVKVGVGCSAILFTLAKTIDIVLKWKWKRKNAEDKKE